MPRRCHICLLPAPPFHGASRVDCPRCGASLVERHEEEQPPPFDPSFGPAVAAGQLSAWEASQRGNRSSYAALLAQRHGLPLARAYEVTDNIVPLSEALGVGLRRARHLHVPLAIAIMTSLAAFASIEVWRQTVAIGKEPPVASLRSRQHVPSGPVQYTTSTEIHRDPQGRLTRVVARTPNEVLQALCDGEPPQDCGVVATQPSRRGFTGSYREQGRTYSIDILHDELTDRWYAGDGLAPLGDESASAPEAPKAVAAEPAPDPVDAAPGANDAVPPAEVTEPAAPEALAGEEAMPAPPPETGEGG